MRKNYTAHHYLLFLPFLLLYVLIVLSQNSGALMGDEGRYLEFAHNLLNGFYSPPPPDINLWNGPGFPIYLMPFVALKTPYIVIKLFNALLYYFTLVLFHKTLSKFFDARRTLLFTLLFACYYMPYKSLPYILSETLTIFLIAAISLFAVDYFSAEPKYKRPGHTLLFALLLSALAMTKVLFGPVYLFASVLFFFLFILKRKMFYRKSIALLILSLTFCIPYLTYTYSISGKYFYWSNAAGMSLYWMSNPVPNEWGEWHNDSLTSSLPDTNTQKLFQSHHYIEYAEIHKYVGVQRDDKFKEIALTHFKDHPLKVVRNWVANWSRLFFNYPVSYVPLRLSTIGNMVANIPVLILLAYSFLLTWRNKNRIPFAFTFLLCISGIYLLGSSLLSAYDRMLYILAPVLGLWVFYSLSFFRKTKIKN